MLPTFAEAMGITHPNPAVVEGRSFLPQLRGKKGNPRPWTYCWYDPLWGNLDQYKNQFVRDHRFKLYQDGRFFDVQEDELEKNVLPPTELSGDTYQAQQSLIKALESMPRWAPKPPNKKP